MQRFLARQPIFTSERTVYGYELLFRSGPENCYRADQQDAASASTVDSILLFGIERLTPGCRAFLNCTRDFLIRDFATMLPKDRVVIEILETVPMDEEVYEACRRLKQAGYLLALDDFEDRADWKPLIALADFIKVDLLATTHEDQLRLARTYSPRNIRMLAEKAETYEDFRRTRDMGYAYFQGYFFSRPEVLSRKDIPANQVNHLQVLQAVNRAQMDVAEVSERIKAEPTLSFRLLRYLNSPVFPLIVEVRSIPHALALLGERGTRKWVSLIAVTCLAGGKPAELVSLPLIRARFCELLAPGAGLADSANDLFLLGLLSTMDAILDMRMAEVLKEIAIREEIRDALLGKANELRDIFEFALHYERGCWKEIGPSAARLGICEDAIPSLYVESVEWARQMLSGSKEELSPPEPVASAHATARKSKR
ncbi:MAG: HDOD domain-containing protein [Candidatus Acidiferrales bacterium]